MRTNFTLLLFCILFSVTGMAQFSVAPPAFSGTAGGNSFTGPLATSSRTYQMLINENQLTHMLGKEILAIAWRAPGGGTGTWPAANATVNNYEIYLGASVTPASRSLASFISNTAGPQTQVRSGSLTIPAGRYTLGSSPNDFGPPIDFNIPYLYSGGHLLVEIRHDGFSGSNRTIDAIGTSNSGYGSNFSACWQGTGNILQGNFGIIGFVVSDVPAPLTLLSLQAKLNDAGAMVTWTTANEEQTASFEIERSIDANHFSFTGSVQAAGHTNQVRKYDYLDKEIPWLQVPMVYYRLKMKDKDGAFTYSPVVPLKLNNKIDVVNLYPNPLKHDATLTIMAEHAASINYQIIDMSGKKMKAGMLNLQPGNNIHVLETSQLPNGAYTLLLQGNDFNQQLKFMKQ